MTRAPEGRTRLGRFAAITVPAALASAGLGVAVIQGMASAALSSSEPFQLGSEQLTASSLQLNLDAASAANSVTDPTAGAKRAARADVTDTTLSTLCLAAGHELPVLGNVVGLKIESPTEVEVGDVTLQADSLNASKAKLPETSIGVASTWDDDTKGGFGLKSQGDVTLDELDAKAYALDISGLTLNDLAISPQMGQPSCG
ncbi:DUF6230 family protein [Janibacter sp. GS2]|uniref:DUF6230 family protein n=1 Tax=Janibacter sp. GS2 TaxID=3442646 RepID=UPI003EB73A0A